MQQLRIALVRMHMWRLQMMTLCGDADGMVSGAMHTTAATIRPGLQVLRTKDSPLVSSVFFMCLPDKVRHSC